MTPWVEESPSVPRKVASPAEVDGAYSETPVCEPIAPAASPAATAVPEPPEEPCAVFEGYSAFHVCMNPDSEYEPELANSERFVLPRITAPASRSRATCHASAAGR